MKDIFDLLGGNAVIKIVIFAFIVVIVTITLSSFEEKTNSPEAKEVISKTKSIPLMMLQGFILAIGIAGTIGLIIWIKKNFF